MALVVVYFKHGVYEVSGVGGIVWTFFMDIGQDMVWGFGRWLNGFLVFF